MDHSLGAIVRNRRRDLGLTQEDLAERVSTDTEPVYQADVSRIETGRIAMPRLGRLLRLAGALQMPIEDLLRCSELSAVKLPVSSRAGLKRVKPAMTSSVDDEDNEIVVPPIAPAGAEWDHQCDEPAHEMGREPAVLWLDPVPPNLQWLAEETRVILRRNAETKRRARELLNQHRG